MSDHTRSQPALKEWNTETSYFPPPKGAKAVGLGPPALILHNGKRSSHYGNSVRDRSQGEMEGQSSRIGSKNTGNRFANSAVALPSLQKAKHGLDMSVDNLQRLAYPGMLPTLGLNKYKTLI